MGRSRCYPLYWGRPAALEAREEDRILALRKGETPRPPCARAAAPSPTAPARAGRRLAADLRDSADPNRNRNRICDAVWMTINETFDVSTQQGADLAFDRPHERLIDGEAYDGLLRGPWREAV